jgi:hypothetical protein
MNRVKYFCLITGLLLSRWCSAQPSMSDETEDSIIYKNVLTGWQDPFFNISNPLSFQFFNHEIRNELGIFGSGILSSNALPLPFSIAVLQNEFIDDVKKMDASAKLGSKNTFEFNYGGGIFFRFQRDSFLFKQPACYTITFRTASVQQVRFTDDLFNVVFFGNAGYAGQTADFSGSSELNYNFNQLRFFTQKKFGKTSQWEGGAGLSFLTARQGTAIQLDRGTLYTEQNGEYIDASYHFTYFVSDSSNHGGLQVDGLGAAADLFLSFMLPDSISKFTFSVNDFGFIGWNKNSRIYRADSSFHFEGIEVTDLLHPADSSLFNFNADTLLKKTGAKVGSEAHQTWLPARFSLMYTRLFNERWMASAGISYRPLTDLLPFFYVQPQFAITPKLRTALLLGYGGTDKFTAGLTVDAAIGKNIALQVGSGNFLGIFVPGETTSTSLFLQAFVNFQ